MDDAVRREHVEVDDARVGSVDEDACGNTRNRHTTEKKRNYSETDCASELTRGTLVTLFDPVVFGQISHRACLSLWFGTCSANDDAARIYPNWVLHGRASCTASAILSWLWSQKQLFVRHSAFFGFDPHCYLDLLVHDRNSNTRVPWILLCHVSRIQGQGQT